MGDELVHRALGPHQSSVAQPVWLADACHEGRRRENETWWSQGVPSLETGRQRTDDGVEE
jgi:hypothetical protein